LEILLLLLLMIAAGILFLPEFLKERVLDSPVDTISDFRRGMTALAISTHNYSQPGRYSYSYGDPEPYVRRSHYTEQADDYPEDIIPYPSNRAKVEMVTRRNRVLALLLVVVMGTGILALIPKLKWIIPLHVIILVILAAYIALAILMPHADSRR